MCSLRKGEVWSKRQLGGARPRGEGKAEGTGPAQGLGRRKGCTPESRGSGVGRDADMPSARPHRVAGPAWA